MFESKKISIFIASVTAALMLITGTFAWQQTISKTNEFIGSKPGNVTLHDDFDPNTGAKDVYVESNSGAPTFVRIKLDEAMNLQSNTWLPSIGDYTTHTYETGSENCDHANAHGEYFHNYFTWVMGGQKYYMPSNGQQLVQDTKEYTASDPGVKETPATSFIKAEDYLNLSDADKEIFVGWIYDTDGYAYWSMPLANGDVTGLLLHKVYVSGALANTDYYYVINVIVESVDEADLPMWTDGAASVDGSGTMYSMATENGKKVIADIQSLLPAANAPIAP